MAHTNIIEFVDYKGYHISLWESVEYSPVTAGDADTWIEVHSVSPDGKMTRVFEDTALLTIEEARQHIDKPNKDKMIFL